MLSEAIRKTHKLRKFLSKVRLNTTLKFHQKATGVRWYKSWNEKKYSHHLHVATALVFFGTLVFSAVLNLTPSKEMLFAANGSWNQTTFNGTNDGVYINTQAANANADVSLSNISNLSNANGGSWQYRRPITINNASGGTLTDYQVQINPFTDESFLNNTGLIGSWHMNEGGSSTVTADSSGNSKNGTLNIGATGTQTTVTEAWTNGANGKFGSSVNFDGTDDNVAIGDLGSFPAQGTLEFWVNAAEMANYRNPITTKYNGYNTGIRCEETAGGNFGCLIGNGTFTPGTYIASGMQINTWYHIVLAWDIAANNMKGYLNGNTTPVFDKANTLWPTTIPDFRIGTGYSTEAARQWKGKVDDVRIYNRVISPTEVSNHYGTAGVPKVRGDYQDVRFTSSDGKTEYSYWQETDGKYWVKVPSLATGDTSINMFYGNPSASSSSIGANTFNFFDDFIGSTLDTNKWDWSGSGTSTVSNSQIAMAPTSNWIRAKTGFTGGYSLRTKFKIDSTAGTTYAWLGMTENVTYTSNALYSTWSVRLGEEATFTYTDGDNTNVSSNLGYVTARDSNFHIAEARRTGTADKFQLDSGAELTGPYPTNNSRQPLVYAHSRNVWLDWMIVRKYTATEPTHTAPGTETGGLISGAYISTAVPSTVAHQGKVYGWGNFTFANTLSGQPITYDILDSATENAITGYTGITTSPTSLTGISAATYPALKVRANLSGDGNVSPNLNDWSVAYLYDLTAPVITSFSINSNAQFTNTKDVTLALTATDSESGVSQMQFSNNGQAWSPYEAYATSKSWDLNNVTYGGSSGDGTKQVLVRVKDAAGNVATYTTASNTSPVADWQAMTQGNHYGNFYDNVSGTWATVTRAGAKTIYDPANQKIYDVPANYLGVNPRSDGKPGSEAVIEESRTNYLLNSYFSADTNSDGLGDNWSKAGSNGIFTIVSTGSPVYGSNYQRVTNSNTGWSEVWQNTLPGTFVAGESATGSFYVRGASVGVTNKIFLRALDVNGTTLATTIGADTALSSAWTRMSATYATLPASTSRVAISFVGGAEGFHAGDSLAVDIVAAQLEKGAFTTSYIPTTTTVATRNADFITVPSSGVYAQGTWLAVEAVPNSTGSYVAGIRNSDFSSSNRINFIAGTSGVNWQVAGADGAYSVSAGGSLVAGTYHSFAGTWDNATDSIYGYVDGTAYAAGYPDDTTASASPFITIGSINNGGVPYGVTNTAISRLLTYTSALSPPNVLTVTNAIKDGAGAINLDSSIPVISFFTINNNAQFTNSTSVTLSLSVTDGTGSGASQMQFSNDGITWSNYETYSNTKAWTLSSGDGTKQVLVRVKDAAGNVATYTTASNTSPVADWQAMTQGNHYGNFYDNVTGTWATVTRAGAKTIYDPANQKIYDVPANYLGVNPRSDGKPGSEAVIEESRTNYLLNSYFSADTNSDGISDGWAFMNSYTTSTASRNNINPIYGTVQKIRMSHMDNQTQGYPNFIANSTAVGSFANGETATGSIWYRNLTYQGSTVPVLNIRGYDAGQTITYGQTWVNLVANDPNWRRASISTTFADANVSRASLRVQQTQNTNGDFFEVEIASAQIEKGAFATSYIPTTTTTTIRNADNVIINTAGMNVGGGTILANAYGSSVAEGYPAIFDATTSGNADWLLLRRAASVSIYQAVIGATSATLNATTGTFPTNTYHTGAMSWVGNTKNLYTDGADKKSTTTGTPIAALPATARIGSLWWSSMYYNAPISRLLTYSSALSDIDVATISTKTLNGDGTIILEAVSPTVSSSTLTSPNGSEKWKGGSSQTITWNPNGITDDGSGFSSTPITLAYTTDGTNYTQIATNEANDGIYTWNPAPLLSFTTVKIRITATDRAGNSSTDVSDNNFTIDSVGPTAPTGVGVAIGTVTSSTIVLSWSVATDTIAGLAGYEVYRAPDSAGVPGAWVSAIGTCSGLLTGTSCVDSGLSANTKYHFRVRAKDNTGNYSSYFGEAVPDANTAGLWHLNEGSGGTTADSSGNGNTGTLMNPSTWSSLGRYGATYSGAGNTSISMGNPASMDFGVGAFSVEVWLKPAEVPNNTFMGIVSKGGYSTGLELRFMKDTNGVNIIDGYIGLDKISTPASWTPNVWTHISFTRDVNGAYKYYKDGSQFGSGTIATNIGSSNWEIGRMRATNIYSFIGQIDEVRISNIARTPTEIANSYAGGYVSKYTLASSPALNTPTSPTNDSRPMITNSLTPDTSFAGNTINLYDGATKVASTKANGSGVFTLGDNKLLNSGFETDSNSDGVSDDWTAYHSGLYGIINRSISNLSLQGGYSQRVQYTGVTGDAGAATGFYQQSASGYYAAGGTAAASIYMRGNVVGCTVFLNIRAMDPGGNPLGWGTAGSVTLSSEWTKLTTVYTNLPANTSVIRVYAYVTSIDPGDTADVYFDSAKLDNYNQNLTDGLHEDITAKAFNAEGIESLASNTVTAHVDTDAPDSPSSVTIAKEGSNLGEALVDNDWNQHNNQGTIYFEFSGANDVPIPPNAGLYRYWVYFGPNANAIPRFDGQVTADNALNVTKTLTNPVTGTDYYLRIQAEDHAGNISTDESVTTLFTYKFDNTPPTSTPQISVSPITWAEADPYTFTWSDGTDTDSGLYGYDYKRGNGNDSWTRQVSETPNTAQVEHYQTGVNYFLLNTVDRAGNVSSTVSWPYLFSGSVGAPQNLQVDISQSQSQTINRFKFSWNPPSLGNIIGYYYSINAAPTTENSTYTTDSFTPFDSFATLNNQVNRFYVVAKDEFDNVGWNNPAEVQFFVNTTPPDVPQDITVVDASNRDIPKWALTVSWKALTNQPPGFNGYEVWRCQNADCSNDINYSKTSEVTTNIYSESGLLNTTDYYYRVKARDNVGNTSSFSSTVHKIPTGKYTTPSIFTSDPKTEAKALSVNIDWTTNRPTNTIVQYGTTTSYGQEASKSTEAVTSHTIEILGLTPGILYHYRVQSLDSERDYDPNSAFSADFTFTTQAAPGISDVTVSEIRLTTAIITWKTTSSATSKIMYGTTSSYGSIYTDNSGSSVTTHTVQLTGLSDSTTYNFKIQGIDVDGNVLNSDNYVFTTLTFPKLTALKIEQQKNSPTSTIKVTFDSNVPVTTQVTATGNGGKVSSNYDLKTTHELVVSGLLDNTPYTVTINARDQYGNNATELSEAYKTEFDTRPPEITEITTETSIIGFGVDAKGQVVVSWTTDEPATSQVEYGPGATGTDYVAKTQLDTTLTQNHVVIISDLKTSSPYHFRVISEDNAKNEAKSDNNSVLTDQANESVIDLIIKSLQSTIGWIFNVFGGKS